MNKKAHLDLTNIPKELHLILDLLKDDYQINKDLFAGIDWDLFLDLVMHHRVYPVLYNKLARCEANLIPSDVLKTLYGQYKRNTFQMLHFSAEMERIRQLLSDHKIRLLFLKGPTLGHDLYGDISLRTSGDLDVLVPIDQLENVEEILLQQGYEKAEYFSMVLNDWKWRHHHFTYFHPIKRIKLEVHWRLNPGPAKEPSFNELWERKGRSTLTNSAIYTLGNEDLFLFLVSHGARHGWSRLRWLLDIHQLMQQKMVWVDMNKQLRKYSYLHVGGQAITLAVYVLGTKLPMTTIVSNRAKQLAQQAIFYLESMINLHTDPLPSEVSCYHKRHLFALMSTRHKLLFLMSFLYPYPEDVEVLRLPKQLHYLYFPLRPLLWAWRKTRAYAVS